MTRILVTAFVVVMVCGWLAMATLGRDGQLVGFFACVLAVVGFCAASMPPRGY